jgi:hypothetical protein
MRVLSNNIQTLLSQEVVNGFVLVRIAGPNINLQLTTYPTDLTVSWLSGTPFSANHNLADVDPPVVSNATNREAYKLAFIDADFSLRTTFEKGVAGATLEVYLGFVNTTAATLGGAVPGAPLMNYEDYHLGFSGVIDVSTYGVDPIEGVVVASVECSSPMASLDLKKSYVTSKNAVQQLNPNDTCYDQVHLGSKSLSMLWGKRS